MSLLLDELNRFKEQSDLVLTEIVHTIVNNVDVLITKSSCDVFNTKLESLKKDSLKILSE
jgi:hypothetical protein